MDNIQVMRPVPLLAADDPTASRCAQAERREKQVTVHQTFVIAGASLAGAKAAEALREEGFEGRVVLIGAEEERPYERPPLSKDYLRGETERSKTYVHEQGFYAENEIELRTGTAASSIDATRSEMVLEGGERLRFDRLLLATGAPRRLRAPGAELEGIYYLRELGDSDAIRERLQGGGTLASRPVLRHPGRSSAIGRPVRELASQGMTFAHRFIGDRPKNAASTPLDDLTHGEGRVIAAKGEKLAVFRDNEGALHALSPVCTHLRCLVEWNRADQTWDCPCHGSLRPSGEGDPGTGQEGARTTTATGRQLRRRPTKEAPR
jgi:nitrite reductase/ring-hydroxylating ferredoxin subunit